MTLTSTEKYLLLIVTIIGVCIINYPQKFQLPVGQTDMAHLYSFVQAFDEKRCLFCESPAYAKWKAQEVTQIRNYPIIPLFFFWTLSKIFDDIILLNGLFLSILYTVLIVYSYLLVKKITNAVRIAAIFILLYFLNFRFIYIGTVGMLPYLLAFVFMFPSLYYFLNYIQDYSKRNFLLCLIFSSLSFFSHFVIGISLLLTQIFLYFGFLFERHKLRTNIKVSFSKCNVNFRVLILFLIFVVIAITNYFLFIYTPLREGWIDKWISWLSSYFIGLQLAWKYPFIFDGPILVILGFLGFLNALYKSEWKIVFLSMSTIFILLTPHFLFGPTKLSNYIYRYYIFLSFLLFFLSAYILPDIKKYFGNVIFAVCILSILVVPISEITYFYMKMEPAMTEEEFYLAKELRETQNQSVLFINKINEKGTFREFKWILAFSRIKNFSVIYDESKVYNLSRNFSKVVLLTDSKVEIIR